MPFITRVELRNSAKEEDYNELHRAMKQAGFTRTIEEGGKTYRLPTAEYNRTDGLTIQKVLSRAKAAALSTNLEYGILVVEYVNHKCEGLEEVRWP